MYSNPAETPDVPHSAESERIVIGTLLVHSASWPEILPQVALLLPRPRAFFNSPLQTIYGVILDLYQRGMVPDLEIVGEELVKQHPQPSGSSWAAELLALSYTYAPVPRVLMTHVQRVKELWQRRELLQAAGRIAQAALTVSIDEIHARSMGLLGQAAALTGTAGGRVSATLVNAALLETLQDPTAPACRFGVPWLDELVRLEGFIVIGAGPSAGKTTLGETIAEYNVEQGKTVLFCSAEMPPVDLARRRLARRAGIAMKRLYGDVVTEEEVRRAYQSMVEQQGWTDRLHYLSGALSVDLIRLEVQALKAEGSLDLILVDYLQLLQAPGNTFERVSEIALGLQHLTQTFNVPLIALSQLSRSGVRQEKPTLDTLRESGAIEQAADIAILIRRNPDTIALPGWGSSYVVDAWVAKHRNGALGEGTLYLVPGRFLMLGGGGSNDGRAATG